MIRVTAVEVVGPYVLHVTFDDGSCRTVDVEPVLWGPMFEPLRDVDRFNEARFDPALETVTWPNEADIAPEYLYEHGKLHTEYHTRR